MRFLLIDRITEMVPGESISAIKNVSLAEEYLADHFPGFPVLPGVLMLEALTQTGGWLMRKDSDFAHSVILMKSLKAVRYNNFVKPGQTLSLTMTVKKKDGPVWDFIGAGTVDGESAVSARMSLVQFNLSDRAPEMKGSDDERRQFYRDLYPQLLASSAGVSL